MSTNITTEQVKSLRDATGISIMQCRKALEEAGGDMDKAIAILKKSSSDIALKKADRTAADGAITIKSDGFKAVLVTLNCETDFVSRNEDFVNLLNTLSDKALSLGLEAMKSGAKEAIDSVIQKTGEKIELGTCYEITGSILGSYVHNAKAGVVVSLEGGTKELARDIAMHVAAMKPEFINQSEIGEEVKKTMTEVFEKEVANIDKPEDIKQKMLAGKIATYFKEKTLVDQPFIKNPNETIGKLLENKKAKIKEVKRQSI